MIDYASIEHRLNHDTEFLQAFLRCPVEALGSCGIDLTPERRLALTSLVDRLQRAPEQVPGSSLSTTATDRSMVITLTEQLTEILIRSPVDLTPEE